MTILRKKMSFNLINRSKHFDAISINKKLEVETVFDKDSGLRYFIIRDIFDNPDQLVELLSQHPAYGGDVEVTTPGHRQLLSSLELPTLTKLYSQLFKEFTTVETKFSSWYYSGNIYQDGMMSSNANHMPRFEPYPFSTQLCLTRDTNMGLTFFKAKLDGVLHARYNEAVKDCDEAVFKRLFPVYSGRTEEEVAKWKNFEGNDDWTPYVKEDFKFNTAVIYDPLYFHQIHFAGNKIESPQYSLVGMLDGPIVQDPFWYKEQEPENISQKTDVSDFI